MILINNIPAHISTYRLLVDNAIQRVLDRSWLVLGPEVQAFEKSFADYLGVLYCRSVANGTDALELALRALGVGDGDKVATVANAGMYTSTAVMAIGATPVYMDVSLEHQVVEVHDVANAIQQGVKAVVVTHLFGQAQSEIAEIAAMCKAAGVMLLEDCAQAHGARVDDKPVGSFGNAGCFSFYPTKNLGALGDGGAVVTSDDALAEKIVRLRQYGWTAKYQVELKGARNSRLDEIQAAVLSEFLPFLDKWNLSRQRIAEQYSTHITHPEVTLPRVRADYVAHLYVVRSPRRDMLRAHLHKHDIATDVHYPIPDYRQPIFRKRFSSIYLPHTELLNKEILTLPCYPEMTAAEITYVIDKINAWPVESENGNTVPPSRSKLPSAS